MEILHFDAGRAQRVEDYGARLAKAQSVCEGSGQAHVYFVYFEAGGEIGPHKAGFGQLFFAVAGDGWVAAGDGQRVSLAEGEAAFFYRGEMHSKGSESGMTALMVQVGDLEPVSH